MSVLLRVKNLPLFGLLWYGILFLSCTEKPPQNIAFADLSEQDKRKPENALASMKVHDDSLELTLFASEPMITNPTNMAIDAKGRVWVCEGTNYRSFANPDINYENKGDRIVILEDTDEDGIADTSRVFYQGQDINSALGIAVLGNKVIVSVSPNVFVFTDTNGDDVPDSKEVLFSGIGGKDHDHGVHSFVFGPDGRLYFNFGNNGERLLDKNGDAVKDKYGNEIVGDGSNFREGMAFRMELDGSKLEVLGHNFRNPYELALDSYGNIWQSDNDDDGNQGTRINYVMDYGNYGFKDWLTGQNWRERRTGWEEEIPFRHWHLNDPGTVPNLLQTGSGSPCGMIVYEGDLLPKKFKGRLIHVEPGHNVVRTYIVDPEGAGFKASIENLLTSEDDWFRPDDVTVAPDGSLFISDWYDGGVGGHKAEDIQRGRIYRLAPSKAYKPKSYSFKTGTDAFKGILSDNMDVFYQSWLKLNEMGDAADPFVKEMLTKGDIAKARALWLGAKNWTKSHNYINLALADSDPKFRAQGVRMARYLRQKDLRICLEEAAQDPSPEVRREVALTLRHIGNENAAEIWSELAKRHDPNDRWYLEALGIGSDKFADLYFSKWEEITRPELSSEIAKQVIWRTRASKTVPLTDKIIRDQKLSDDLLERYFRSLDFKEHPQKNQILLSLLNINHPKSKRIQALAIAQLDKEFVLGSSRNLAKVKAVLPKIQGTPEWLMAVKRLELKDQNNYIFEMAQNSESEDLQKEAANLLTETGGTEMIADYLRSTVADNEKMNFLKIMGGVSNDNGVNVLKNALVEDSLSAALNRQIVEALGNSWSGQHSLYDLLENDKLPENSKTAAVLKLMNSWSSEIKQKATQFLADSTQEDLNIEELVAIKGDADKGQELYTTYCSSCHMAANKGVEFGPALSDIGNKLSKQFLYSNIIYPSAGISFGYEGYTVEMNEGSIYTGYVLSRTEDEITLKMMGDTQKSLNLADVHKMEAMDRSLMTEGLHKVMSKEDLVNLVEYLTTLKVDEQAVAVH